MNRLLKNARLQQPDGWYNSSSFELGSQDSSSAKRPRVSSTPATLPRGERHDGQSVPSRLYGYTLGGKPLEPASLKRVRRVTTRIQQHLKAVASQLDERTYKPMTPFPSSIASGAKNDTAVYIKHGLVYRVLRQANGTVHSSLLYTFYVPLDFLEYPIQQLGGSNGLESLVPDGAGFLSLPEDTLPENTTDADGTGSGTACQQEDNPNLLTCLGVETGLASPYHMVVDDVGEVTCTEVSANYRPAQFKILNDNTNNTLSKHVVGIRCLGMGPNRWFLAIVQDESTGKWRFKAEEADADTFVPKDPKFHFVLTLAEEGFVRFKSAAGDGRYLAFGSTGEQVTVRTTGVISGGDRSKYTQTLFSFSPL